MFCRTKLCTGLMWAFGGGLLIFSWPASAQETQRIEITGSSIKRIDAETALPVQVLTRKDIEKSGAVNVEQLLQTVSAITSSGGTTASTSSSATTGGLSAISLRGLTSVRTLVLLNGRRIAPYGIGSVGDSVSVDVNSIPLAAVERVEILKEGASAIYGSDAIAGVVNFILQKDFTGTELSAFYGDSQHGGGKTQRATVKFGFGDISKDRFNVMAVASFQKEGALLGGDRAFANKGYNEQTLTDSTSGNTYPANIFIPFGPTDTGITANPSAPTCPGPYAFNDPLFGSDTFCRYDPAPIVTLLPESERTSLFVSGKFAISNNLEAFAEASFNRNKQRTIIQPVPLSDQFALPDTHPLFNTYPYTIPDTDPVFGPYIQGGAISVSGVSTFVLNPNSPFYPTTYVQQQTGGVTPPILVRYRAAEAGNRDLTNIADAPRFTAGLRGTAAGWDFETAFLWSQSKVREIVNGGYPAYSQIMPLLNSGLVNPFGANTPEVQAQLRATSFLGDAYKIKSTLTSLAARGSRELAPLRGGALGLAVGAEVRKEDYLFDPSPTIQTGDISGYGGNFLVTDRSRNVMAAFVELNAPVLKSLEFNGAVRFDHYQGVGNSTTPKLSMRWQPVREVLVRGSAGRGFRAPSLQDLYLPATLGVTTVGLNDPLRCVGSNAGNNNDCNTQFSTTFGGNPNLKPEKSTNLTLGLVLEPTRNLSIGIDGFKIKLTDTIVNGVVPELMLQTADNANKYSYLITRGAASGGLPGPITNIDQRNLNLGTTWVNGFDLDARWTIPAGEWGKFTASLSGTYFRRYDTSNPDGTIEPGVDLVNTSTGGVVPRWKHYLALDWTRGSWGATIAQNWQKSYYDIPGTFQDPDDPGYTPRIVGAYETYDAQVSYSGFDKVKLTLGVRNLFDRDPPFSNAGGQTSFQTGYDPEYGDPRGRFFYGSVSYSF